jgi:hypothetical protein
MGTVYGLPRHLFDEERIERWADRRGALVKSIEDAALGMASVYRAVGLALPSRMPNAGEETLGAFQQLLAQYMPFTLVIDEQTASGDNARVSKTSVCGSWGPITGELRYFADKFGNPRASIEGTQIPYERLRPYATVTEGELLYNPESKRSPLVLRRRVESHGFELEREIEPLNEFPPELAERARHALAEALARGEARHPGTRRNQEAIDAVRETYRRSGGATPRLSFVDLTAIYERQLSGVNSLDQFRHTTVYINADDIVPAELRSRYAQLPSTVSVRGREVEVHYDVEESATGTYGVARLRLPEKLARTLASEELPALDRPLRFIVTRGARGAARASTLDALQEELDRPFSAQELEDIDRAHGDRQRERHERKRQRRTRDSGDALKEHRKLVSNDADGRRGPPRGRGGGGRRRRRG